jgi:DNA-directed RNA polymerase sigma subunit (sigma70/sigma32)
MKTDITDKLKNIIEHAIVIKNVWNKSKLQSRNIRIVKLRFGIDVSKPYTLKELSEEFGISIDRVRQIEAKALRIARKYCLDEGI